jgi:hypothetical protein
VHVLTTSPEGRGRPQARAILQVAFGPHAGRKVILAPGEVVRVGRSDDADVVLAHDRALAHVHFEIDWDGERCRARHRDGRATLVGGRPIDQADVPHGGWIRAGDTVFLLHAEHRTPPDPDALFDDDDRASAILALLRERHDLWAVLDTTRHPRILQALRESVDPARSLYEGTKGDALADAAPWLVRLQADSRLLDILVQEGWGQAWGVFFAWDAPEKEVRRHLRRFLMVEEEETRAPLYFRFYDPRALRIFVPTCSVRQLHALFGDIEAFFLEGETGDLLRFARSDITALADGDP